MSHTHNEPAPEIDGTPTCVTCHSTRFRDRAGWSECLGCGDRYTASATAAAEVEQWATATPTPDTGGLEYPEPVAEPATAPAAARTSGKKGGWTGAVIFAVLAVAVWALFFRGGSPGDCMARSTSDAADLTKNLNPSDFGKVAAITRDGGTYVAAKLQNGDTAVWFQTASGTTYSVGPVTALYSTFPDSAAHTKAGVGTDGYSAVKACVS